MPVSKTATASSSCAGGCPACGARNSAPDMPVQGWRLVGAAAGVFLLPLAGAALGAAWSGPGAARQAFGLLVGAGIGVGLARAGYNAARRSHRRREDSR